METTVLKKFSACEPSYDNFIRLANMAKALADKVYQLEMTFLVKTGQAGNLDPAIVAWGSDLLKIAKKNLDRFVEHVRK